MCATFQLLVQAKSLFVLDNFEIRLSSLHFESRSKDSGLEQRALELSTQRLNLLGRCEEAV